MRQLTWLRVVRVVRTLALVGLQALALWPNAAPAADKVIDKTIRLITPYTAGGSTDTLARIIAPQMSEMLGVSVVVEAMPGANGVLAMDYLSKQRPDGSTLVITSASPIVINPHTFPNIHYDALNDYTDVTLVAQAEAALLVNPAIPARNLKELIALSKKQPIRIGVAGRGGQPELILAKINKDTGANLEVVPYVGGGPAIIDAVGGHIDGVLNDIAGTVAPMVKTGKLRPVAILTSNDKSVMLPDFATLKAQGMPLDWELQDFLVMLGPKGMPPEVAETLRKTVVDIVTRPEIAKSLAAGSLVPFPSSSVADAHAFITREYNAFGKIQQQTGVKVQ